MFQCSWPWKYEHFHCRGLGDELFSVEKTPILSVALTISSNSLVVYLSNGVWLLIMRCEIESALSHTMMRNLHLEQKHINAVVWIWLLMVLRQLLNQAAGDPSAGLTPDIIAKWLQNHSH